MKDNEAAEKAWKIIDSIMKKESIDEVTLERQYLPEVFDSKVLELSKEDGLPTLKPFILIYLGLKGFITKLYGNVLKLTKDERDPELKSYLDSKINLYLEANKILDKIDNKKSQNFKKLYADAMIREGNLNFNRKEYETAASQYERAGQWSSKELLDKELVNEAFRLAINSWISACQVENAFRILENLPHEEAQNILKPISEKIGAAAEFLMDSKKYELAKDQLYIAVNKYQREALSDELKYLTNKLTEVLIQIFKIQVESSEINAAKNTYEEIEFMWDCYKVEKTDLDSILKALITFFVEKNNFGIGAALINKLNSLRLKQDLSKISAELEAKYKDSIKKENQEYIKKGEEILAEYVKAELDIITDMNRKKIEEK